MSKPTVGDLGNLFAVLSTRLIAKLGDPDCPASIIKEARELLKDNDIVATPGSEALKNLSEEVAKLPFGHEAEG